MGREAPPPEPSEAGQPASTLILDVRPSELGHSACGHVLQQPQDTDVAPSSGSSPWGTPRNTGLKSPLSGTCFRKSPSEKPKELPPHCTGQASSPELPPPAAPCRGLSPTAQRKPGRQRLWRLAGPAVPHLVQREEHWGAGGGWARCSR